MDGPRVTIQHLDSDPIAARSTEFVERKGLGHPDTMCDGFAEAISRRLADYYLDHAGRICHHNTDAVQIVAGTSAPEFGGGEIVEPIHVQIGGRARTRVDGTRVPVDELAIQAASSYVAEHFPALERDMIDFDVRIGETSPDLRSLFDSAGVPLANDTSVGVGYAPLSETDRIVADVERAVRTQVEAVGEDVKVMGWRADDQLRLTVAAAVLSRAVPDLEAYLAVREEVQSIAEQVARERTTRSVSVVVNAADDVASGSVYLTETGLSAEMGDDGNVGRGNRANGLITPHRPVSPEATAGKNALSHVGKLYNVIATRAAERIHDELGGEYAAVTLLSQIGEPVDTPQAIDVDTTAEDDEVVEAIVKSELAAIESVTQQLVAGEISVF